jgi:hypothetical protein
MVDQLLGYTMALRMDEQMLEQLLVLWSMYRAWRVAVVLTIIEVRILNEWFILFHLLWISKPDNFEEKKGLQLFYLKQIISTIVSC